MILKRWPLSLYKKQLRRIERLVSSTSNKNVNDGHCNKSTNLNVLDKIRNIGILAHIDAGKTTTTERMLFYSGKIRNMGEVHLGNTVTDYMEQERNRGITITSAAVTFAWHGHRFNLIDTPGHIDFTMEVEQALNVMDGAVIVLDGSAGVEAQTLTVWRQADHYHIPRIVFTNKMDRQDADLHLSLDSLRSKLDVCPLALFLPIKERGKLVGLVDVVRQERCVWRGERGEEITRATLSSADPQLYETMMQAREQLTDTLTDLDGQLADSVLQLESLADVTSEDLSQALRRVTLAQARVPVMCGSAYKNIGVQTIMNAVIDYLPSPTDCPQLSVYNYFKDTPSARVFKVIHDKHKGPLSFLRIYTGKLEKGQRLYNMKQDKSETITKLMVVEADDFEEVSEVTQGNIAAASGLKFSVIGDLLTSSASAASKAKLSLMKKEKLSEEEAEAKFNIGAVIPDPVFFCSIEPPSLASQQSLEDALKAIQKEDPSLRVSFDEEIGQTILAGMGELHLEVIRERIRSEYKIEADIGQMQIAYREKLTAPVTDTFSASHSIGNSKHYVKVTITLLNEKKKDIVILDKSKASIDNTSAITFRQLKQIRQGVESALTHGPVLGVPVMDVTVVVHWLEVGRGTSDTILASSVSQCIKKMLSAAGTVLVEPVMSLEVVTDEQCLPLVLADLSRRRSQVQQVTVRGNNKIVEAQTPLAELLGYSKALRTFTSGTSSFTMEFASFQEMGPTEQAEAIRRVTGF
ncbi:ribosome-releasing factor 2, mitochondrial [Macrosteles quadrilineatus]|uniref:ribosome-releasing factor 2, mitochondrial n=1 Tax=Macrosteles quadrilineatus TaxID=74068 RepID=UPI0023E1DE43|nr:ribosome-releasing factor 2, mitochondrial [Macrosteles quadrilineatus]XP_054264981.1 ribosome-releasing factor 2, mitochondrial [Macrosteles quadrilineatus]